jgi:penicillin amidase
VRRWFARLLLVSTALIVLFGLLVAWRLWRALPVTNGEITIAGLLGPVEIVRDADGVPHIRASSERDAWLALGYAHAQDRLWQMEFQRRLASGRLAEILGAGAVETDRFMRTVGFARAAAASLDRLDHDTRELIDAYVAGVNAWIGGHAGTRLPIEFALVKDQPGRWEAADVLAWQKVMGWSMSVNWREELLRVRLASRLGDMGAATLLPDYTSDGPVVLPDFVPPPAPASSRARGVPAFPPHVPVPPGREPIDPVVTGASNNWVLAPGRTSTRSPILANDPHLGTQAPGVWYVAHVSAGSLDAVGATLPGTPGVVVGHNRRIAWGVTNMLADVQDLFVERINGRNTAEVDGRWEPMRVLHETIRVRDAEPITLRVRVTRHGPLISDILDERTPLALRWTGHDAEDLTARTFMRINRAESWDAFVDAFDGYHLPMLNFVYADIDGHIGYIGPGALPIRAGDGRYPLAGWDSTNDWRGYVPLAELPRSLDPARGFIASANNKVVPESYPYVISTSWEAPYRAERITRVLESLRSASLTDMQQLQMDQRSAQAARLLPFLLRARPSSERARRALDRLRDWDGAITARSAEAALFKAYAASAAAQLFADDLGSSLWKDYRALTGTVAKALEVVSTGDPETWCDDVGTASRETCPAALGQALESALDEMAATQGTPDLARWRWGNANDVWFPHLPFHASVLLRPFFSRHIARGGDAFTVNPSMPVRDQLLVASYRQIIDLGNFDRSVFILPLGQSGHLMSGHYSDMLDDWNEGRYRPLRFSVRAVDQAAAGRLRLLPPAPSP